MPQTLLGRSDIDTLSDHQRAREPPEIVEASPFVLALGIDMTNAGGRRRSNPDAVPPNLCPAAVLSFSSDLNNGEPSASGYFSAASKRRTTRTPLPTTLASATACDLCATELPPPRP